MSIPEKKLRLDRLLANMGYGSRREIHKIVRAGMVTLDGQEVESADMPIHLTPDLPTRLHVDNEPLDPLPGLLVMMHKPLGITCSHSEAGELVYDLLPPRWSMRNPSLSTIGRLDKETSGLLLLTDDGDLLHRVISPKNHVPKRYQVTLEKNLRGDEGVLFASGTMMLPEEKKPLLPVQMEVKSPLTATLILTEGRYHQVRRMFEAVQNNVIDLHRDRIGGIDLPEDLNSGEFRVLSLDWEKKLYSA